MDPPSPSRAEKTEIDIFNEDMVSFYVALSEGDYSRAFEFLLSLKQRARRAERGGRPTGGTSLPSALSRNGGASGGAAADGGGVRREIVADCEAKLRASVEASLGGGEGGGGGGDGSGAGQAGQTGQAGQAGTGPHLAALCRVAVSLGLGARAAQLYGNRACAELEGEMRGIKSNLVALREMRGRLAHVSSGEETSPHLTALTGLLNATSARMAALSEAGLGANGDIMTIGRLHEQCSAHLLEVIDMFIEDKHVEQWTRDAGARQAGVEGKNARGGAGGGGSGWAAAGPSSVSVGTAGSSGSSGGAVGDVVAGDERLLEVDLVIDQLAWVCQMCEGFLQFTSEEVRSRAGDTEAARGALQKLSERDPVAVKIQEAVNQYVQLEFLSIGWSVEKAIRIAEPTDFISGIDMHVQVSSVVEDVFLILKRASGRAVGTLQPLAACAVANHLTHILGGPLMDCLRGLALSGTGGGTGGLLQASGAAQGGINGGGGTGGAGSGGAAGTGGGSGNGVGGGDAGGDGGGAEGGGGSSSADADAAGGLMGYGMSAFSRALESATQQFDGMLQEAEVEATKVRAAGLTDEPSNTDCDGGNVLRLPAGTPSDAVERVLREAFLGVNTMEVAAEYNGAMTDEVHGSFAQLVAGGGSGASAATAMMEPAMQEMRSLSGKFEAVLEASQRRLLEGIVPPLRLGLVRRLGSCDYVLDAAAYELREEPDKDPFALAFASELVKDERIALCRRSLHPTCFDALILHLATNVASLLELQWFVDRALPFTEFGAMQLEKEIRVVVDAIESLSATCSGVRSRFARLHHCSLLLNLERPGDLAGYALPPSAAVLKVAEIREVMKRRIDFDKRTIDDMHIDDPAG